MEDKNDILLKQLFEQAAQQQIEDNGFTERVMMNLPEVKESRVRCYTRLWTMFCVVMAILFGMLHVRNFPGAFISALFYGLVFIWSRNIWFSVILHTGRNLAATLLAVYCWLKLGDIQMAKIPVIILPDIKVVFASLFLAIAGVLLLKKNNSKP